MSKYANDQPEGPKYSNPEAQTIMLGAYSAPDISQQAVVKDKEDTPTRFWLWFNESDFIIPPSPTSNEGNFGKVIRAQAQTFNRIRTKLRRFAGQEVALKYPKQQSNWTQEFHKLSHEISCTIIAHPSIVNYLGGLSLKNPNRVGTVMEFVHSDLRHAISRGLKGLNLVQNQWLIAKKIASGMNLLHSLNPYVLHRDLRAPNVLISEDLKDVKIADFGISDNVAYSEMKHTELYTDIRPPECKGGKPYTTKGDVFFFGWILAELFSGSQPHTYVWSQDVMERIAEPQRQIVSQCLVEDPDKRPEFRQLMEQFNQHLQLTEDLELICSTPIKLQHYVETVGFDKAASARDSYERNLWHLCSMYGNMEGLSYLERFTKGNDSYLKQTDKYGYSCGHFAGRSGHIEIIKYLATKKFNFDLEEKRFDTTALSLAIAMKHFGVARFLADYCAQKTLDQALISACSEGFIDIVQLLLEKGASITCTDPELHKPPLCWASGCGHLEIVKLLLDRGADPNSRGGLKHTSALGFAASKGYPEIVELLAKAGANIETPRSDGRSPLWKAASEGKPTCVKKLLELGADVDRVDDRGITPLYMACKESKNKECARLLIAAKADVNKVRQLAVRFNRVPTISKFLEDLNQPDH